MPSEPAHRSREGRAPGARCLPCPFAFPLQGSHKKRDTTFIEQAQDTADERTEGRSATAPVKQPTLFPTGQWGNTFLLAAEGLIFHGKQRASCPRAGALVCNKKRAHLGKKNQLNMSPSFLKKWSFSTASAQKEEACPKLGNFFIRTRKGNSGECSGLSVTRQAQQPPRLSWLEKWERCGGSLVPSNGQEARLIPLLQEAPAASPYSPPAHKPHLSPGLGTPGKPLGSAKVRGGKASNGCH